MLESGLFLKRGEKCDCLRTPARNHRNKSTTALSTKLALQLATNVGYSRLLLPLFICESLTPQLNIKVTV